MLGFRISHWQHQGSVLPRINATRTREGMRIHVPPNTWKDVAILILIGSFVIGLTLMLIYGRRNGREGSVAGGIITLAGGLVELGRRYVRQQRLESTALTVTPWPLRLGEQASAKLTTRLRVVSVDAKLACVEEVKKSAGKYEETSRATRFETAIDTSRPEWTFETLTDGLPSLAVKSNRVQWLVQAVIKTRDHEIPAEFELLVIPERAS